ncbi:MAG: hypothetical protein ACYTE3_31795 [Planctomycetota bacterium]|jgi:hypothetical protein
MATKAQIKANKQNSQKSTGPRTAEGKEAVSQNAFKHGLFVNKAIVRDESQDEYDRYRQAVLAEVQPVGELESIVAERLVNLTWRLERAQRMQNQSIDCIGMEQLAGHRASDFRELYREANGLSCEDLEIPDDHLYLGRLAVRDWRYCKVLDKMMLYERRIENSMYKTMRELERLQESRKAGQARPASCRGRLARASRGHPAHDSRQNSEANTGTAEHQSAEESPPARRHRSDLKKQSQFAPALMGTNSCVGKDYDNVTPAVVGENKAKRSQSQEPTASGQRGTKNKICRAG